MLHEIETENLKGTVDKFVPIDDKEVFVCSSGEFGLIHIRA